MRLLPVDQWTVSCEEGSVLLGAYDNAGYRHYLSLTLSGLPDELSATDALDGLKVEVDRPGRPAHSVHNPKL